MKNFNTQRFQNFGRYDLAINRAFLRNMILLTVGGSLALILTCFFARKALWDDFVEAGMTEVMARDAALNPNGEVFISYQHYAYQVPTVFMLLGFLSIMCTAVFPGCWAHNLRNRQGRINELTIPASNLEKFAWHMLLAVGGGLLLSFATLLVCDLTNWLLALWAFPHEGLVPSMTLQAFSALAGTDEDGLVARFLGDSLLGIRLTVFASMIFSISAYVLGNSIKYRYNIIFTFLVVMVIQNIFGWAVISTVLALAHDAANPYSVPESEGLLANTYIIITILAVIASIICCFASYQLYRRAQITSSRNK